MGITLMKFNPFTGRYLFHLHTRFTDGQLSVKDHFDYAQTSCASGAPPRMKVHSTPHLAPIKGESVAPSAGRLGIPELF